MKISTNDLKSDEQNEFRRPLVKLFAIKNLKKNNLPTNRPTNKPNNQPTDGWSNGLYSLLESHKARDKIQIYPYQVTDLSYQYGITTKS